MPKVAIRDDIAAIIDRIEEGDDINGKLERVLISEIRRKLVAYRRIDRKFREKYGMILEEFEKREIVKKKGYSFEVESDYHEWDAAVDGNKSLEKDLESLCQR